MTKVHFITSRCKGCGLCVQFCPNGCLKMSADLNEQGRPYPELADAQTCTTCGICFRMCPDAAIEVNREEKSTCKTAGPKSGE